MAIDGVNWTGSTSKRLGLKEFEVFKDNAPTANETMENISGVSLFPNPASHILNIKIPLNRLNSHLTVTDVSGRVIESITMEILIKEINLSGHSKGLYIVQINSHENY